MNIGKIPNDILENLLNTNTGIDPPEILIGPGIGVDCGVIDFGQEVCVMSTDPITGAVNKSVYLAVHIAQETQEICKIVDINPLRLIPVDL